MFCDFVYCSEFAPIGRRQERSRAGKKKVIDARARIRLGTEEDEEGEGSPSGFQRRASPGRADRKYRVAHQIFRRERPRVMAASRPDGAHRVIGRGKEKDTVGMSKGEGGTEGGREAERKREIYSIVVRRQERWQEGEKETRGTKKDDGSFGIA